MLHVIVREGPGTYQAHVASKDRPELWQLVDAEPSEEAADDRNQPRIVLDLIPRLTLLPPFRSGAEILLELLLRVALHGADLRHRDATAIESCAGLNEERRPPIEQYYQR